MVPSAKLLPLFFFFGWSPGAFEAQRDQERRGEALFHSVLQTGWMPVRTSPEALGWERLRLDCRSLFCA